MNSVATTDVEPSGSSGAQEGPRHERIWLEKRKSAIRRCLHWYLSAIGNAAGEINMAATRSRRVPECRKKEAGTCHIGGGRGSHPA